MIYFARASAVRELPAGCYELLKDYVDIEITEYDIKGNSTLIRGGAMFYVYEGTGMLIRLDGEYETFLKLSGKEHKIAPIRDREYEMLEVCYRAKMSPMRLMEIKQKVILAFR